MHGQRSECNYVLFTTFGPISSVDFFRWSRRRNRGSGSSDIFRLEKGPMNDFCNTLRRCRLRFCSLYIRKQVFGTRTTVNKQADGK
jgi:hypothetical protein